VLKVEEVELEAPHDHEVLVRIRAAGVCHSDLHTYKGELRSTPPVVLGHEGAGVVEAVGPGVTRVKPGDRVMINWLPCLRVWSVLRVWRVAPPFANASRRRRCNRA
jgi:S-(hydroxymethyl)glutathione dehydrogenase/alcohol dehydrogenase